MARLVSDLMFSTGVTFFVLAWVVGLMLAIFWPFMAWSAMRNVKGIRQELERLNNTLSNNVHITKTGPLGL